jgi:Flp pilus assembly pilin Flp
VPAVFAGPESIWEIRVFRKFLKCESGIAAIEFLLIASIMAMVLVAIMPTLASSTSSSYSSIAGHISSGV